MWIFSLKPKWTDLDLQKRKNTQHGLKALKMLTRGKT